MLYDKLFVLLAGGGLHWQGDGEGPGKVFRQGDGGSKEIQSEGKLSSFDPVVANYALCHDSGTLLKSLTCFLLPVMFSRRTQTGKSTSRQ